MIANWINSAYTNEETLKKLNKDFFKSQPFHHIELKDFFKEEKINLILEELKNESYEEKDSDLFRLLQTKDLSISKQKNIREFVNLLNSKELIKLIEKITSITLKPGKTDISSVIYRQYDYLLCHDDLIENRKIAFILNLSGFNKDDGGKLQIFNSKNKAPTKIVKQIIPSINNLVLFQVSPISFHQVEEVYTEKERVTISGWFNG